MSIFFFLSGRLSSLRAFIRFSKGAVKDGSIIKWMNNTLKTHDQGITGMFCLHDCKVDIPKGLLVNNKVFQSDSLSRLFDSTVSVHTRLNGMEWKQSEDAHCSRSSRLSAANVQLD